MVHPSLCQSPLREGDVLLALIPHMEPTHATSQSFVSYRVTYRPASGPGSSVHPAGVIRRFSDFDWLKKQLRANHRGG